MKKFFLILLLLVLLVPIITTAQTTAPLCDDSSSGADGMVPCGRTPNCRCELGHVFILIFNIYRFILFDISTPLAGLMIVIGGIMLLVSAGNPNLASLGKKILWGAIIGWLLIWGAWLIIHTVLLALGIAD